MHLKKECHTFLSLTTLHISKNVTYAFSNLSQWNVVRELVDKLIFKDLKDDRKLPLKTVIVTF